MKSEVAGDLLLLTNAEGVLHVPFTLYLNMEYENPHTKAAAARGLRLFVRLVDAFDIDLASRALEGRCLGELERATLCQLAFQPIEKIEKISIKAIKNIFVAQKTQKTKTPCPSPDLLSETSADKQLTQISGFLVWYHRKVLEPRMPIASPVTEALRRAYEDCVRDLKKAVTSRKSIHPHKIRSAPAQTFLSIYRKVFLHPEEVLLSEPGMLQKNLMRDRAIILTAAEGIRPGAVGNIALADFQWEGGNKSGYIRIKDNIARRSTHLTVGTPTQKGIRSSQEYNSEVTVSIWPTTAKAIFDYIHGEREEIARTTLQNKTKGFLFVANHGGPIGDRSTISAVFRRASTGLERLGLLDKSQADPYTEGERYSFNAYLLRHSSASLFFSNKVRQQSAGTVEDVMKDRYGWSKNSKMPGIYAKRAKSEAASLTLEDFIGDLLAEAKERAQRR